MKEYYIIRDEAFLKALENDTDWYGMHMKKDIEKSNSLEEYEFSLRCRYAQAYFNAYPEEEEVARTRLREMVYEFMEWN